jgi:hypothetical protein
MFSIHDKCVCGFQYVFRPKTHGREDVESQGREMWPPAEMVEILMQENSSLKAELEACYQKVSKSQKVRD